MDKIILKDMAFYGYHGLLKEESVSRSEVFYRYRNRNGYKRSWNK